VAVFVMSLNGRTIHARIIKAPIIGMKIRHANKTHQYRADETMSGFPPHKNRRLKWTAARVIHIIIMHDIQAYIQMD
jgi:hypothetical protein